MIFLLMVPQEKRKMPALPNGSSHYSDIIKEAEHQTGPELQRTGRCVSVHALTHARMHTHTHTHIPLPPYSTHNSTHTSTAHPH